MSERVCVCVCVGARARARVRAWVSMRMCFFRSCILFRGPQCMIVYEHLLIYMST